MNIKLERNTIQVKNNGLASVLRKDFSRNAELYLLILPVIAFYIIFHYIPMYGVIIAFKNFNPALGILRSPWAGFEHFQSFISSYYFVRILKNTLWISLNSLLIGFPAPIILALLINELRSRTFSRGVQTITYMPHFISMVVICGIIKTFVADHGLVSYVVSFFTGDHINLLNKSDFFVPIYVWSGVWQEVGWGSIIYLAALTGIDQELYEAARIDGANRWKQTLHITLPGITPTIIILLILRLGSMLNVGFEKIILLYSPTIYDVSDVISSFVYRKGLLESNWSYSAAVGLFNSVINFVLLVITNKLSKKYSETSLW